MSTATALAYLFGVLPQAVAQDRPFWEENGANNEPRRPTRTTPRPVDAYQAPEAQGPAGGFGQQADVTGRPYDGRAYDGRGGGYSSQPDYNNQQPPAYNPPTYGQALPQAPQRAPSDPYASSGYGGGNYGSGGYGPGGVPVQRGNDAYQPPRQAGAYDSGRQDGYRPDAGSGYPPAYSEPNSGYGQPYTPPPDQYAEPGYPDRGSRGYDDRQQWNDRRGGNTYSQNEVVETGHRFFGSISQGLASAVESVFKRQGRPNGYILGEDAGGAFVAGLRYGEGVLSTKDAGTHRVFWQGPSLGYDFGGEGSKTMVLVYNLRDPSDIYRRFGGVQGAAYLIGGVSVQFQAHEGVTLAVIRSGVGLRLGANVGYLKYTRTPTWNPF